MKKRTDELSNKSSLTSYWGSVKIADVLAWYWSWMPGFAVAFAVSLWMCYNDYSAKMNRPIFDYVQIILQNVGAIFFAVTLVGLIQKFRNQRIKTKN